ncbi:MAG: tRNA (adenosine(37)-N6)-threonylcarbamoyltransferase complex dimerization subunit type 1 TsaB [Methyloprofundus sp.]|nr:tRNA (adenosine(37)-N6)-threonylcarbamoyltransferase complex dimerization subunit type 1 TsaB [Methyloprofundus sp.]MDT8426105.1 tRNA (adenosine(37)-N6)-threonylcarbamoyltransferase complex dimerization subunit type 1 TsaB [Methyloprofundus sp.]
MKILAIDTATEACSAALYIEGEIQERFVIAPREHAKLLLPMIDSLMAEADLRPQQLDAIAFGCGPGSFTGVRIATGVMQGIAYGADLPVVPVSTLAAISQACLQKTSYDTIFTAVDARMNEIYWAVYQRDAEGFAQLIGVEKVQPASEVDALQLTGYGIGSGWSAYEQVLTQHLGAQLLSFDVNYLPRSAQIALLGAVGMQRQQALPVEQAMPVYLRDKVAKTTAEREALRSI